MKRNYQDIWSNTCTPGGRVTASSAYYSVIKADGTIISWKIPPSSDKASLKSRAF